MQNRGVLKVLVIALIISAAYALSFTFVSMNVEKKADNYAAAYDIEHREEARQTFLDSMKSETAYNLGFMKFTYGQVKEKEINLGLDLKGGMNVLLEISPKDIVRALSGHNQDEVFNRAIAEAEKTVSGDFVDNFARAYEQLSGGADIFMG